MTNVLPPEIEPTCGDRPRWRDVVALGELPSLSDLGGPSGILRDFDHVVEISELPHVVGLLAGCWEEFNEEERMAAQQVVLGALNCNDPLQTPDVLELILMSPKVLNDIGQELAAASVKLSRSSRGLVGGAALEAVVRLALGGYSRQAVARGLLVEVGDDIGSDHENVEHEWFLRSVCRAVGAALESWNDPDGELIDLLQALAREHDEVVDDACFELAMNAVAGSLRHSDPASSRTSLNEARDWLTKCVRYNDERPDAELFLATIDVTLNFLDGQMVATGDVDRVRSLAARYLVEELGETPGWRQPRADVAVSWWRVVEALSRISEIDSPHWWDPPGIIAAIGDAYGTCRTLRYVLHRQDNDDQVVLISPRVKAPFLADAGRMLFIERWLSESIDVDPSRRREVDQVLTELRALQAQGPPGKSRRRPAGEEEIRRALTIDQDTAERIADILADHGLLDTVAAAVRQHDQVVLTGHGLYYDQVHRELLKKLSECPDYAGAVRAASDQILSGLLLFVRERLDAETGGIGSPNYLRRLRADESDPLEVELAKDLRDFLRATIGGAVHSEVRNKGGGRTDLIYVWPTFEIVIECKRRKRGESSRRRGGQVSQAEQYQITDIPIGFLIILDLTEKAKLLDLEECGWIETIEPEDAGVRTHYVGVFIVQGNKPTPSSRSR